MAAPSLGRNEPVPARDAASARRLPRSSPLLLALGVGLFGFAVLATVRGGLLPSAGLDPSWKFAAEFAGRHRLVFGRDFVFTYGPYAEIATRLFDPATFPRVLFYDVFGLVAVFWIPLANRSLSAAFALALSYAFLQSWADGPITAALFAVFLITLQRRDLWSLVFVALCAPLVLSKYSFALVIVPLLLLSDLHRLSTGRAPLLTATLGAAVLLADLAAGQPLSALPALIVNTLAIVLGYGRAMQMTGPASELLLTVLICGAAIGFGALLAWRAVEASRDDGAADVSPLFAAAGFAWVLFMAFKMGFVRHDDHTMIFHEIAPPALALMFGFVDRRALPERRLAPVFWLLFLVVLGWAVYWRSEILRPQEGKAPSVSAYLGDTLGGLGPRMSEAVGWLGGGKIAPTASLRRHALARLQRRFPASVRGSADAAPTELSELIASGVDYRPRPVIQSYSSYTPHLQALDRAHLAGPQAPDTLLLKIEDIDLRLPTLALGPSLPVIGQRYDPVARDPMGLILRRRATPRPMSARTGPAQTVALNIWVPAPGRPGRLLMAHVTVHRTLAGRIVGFLFREPQMQIELRTARGAVSGYRFIPDMAQLGVAVSPIPINWDQPGVLFDPQAAAYGAPVTAIRISSHAAGWAFSGATVQYEEIAYAPGFNALMPPPAVRPALEDALQRLGVSVGREGQPASPGAQLPARRLGADPALCRGWFDAVNLLQAGSPVWEAVGWGWDVQAGRVFDRVVITDETGRVVGAALSGQPRPDVPKAVPQVRSAASGWKGVALRRGGGKLLAYGLLGDGRACELGHMDWPG